MRERRNFLFSHAVIIRLLSLIQTLITYYVINPYVNQRRFGVKHIETNGWAYPIPPVCPYMYHTYIISDLPFPQVVPFVFPAFVLLIHSIVLVKHESWQHP